MTKGHIAAWPPVKITIDGEDITNPEKFMNPDLGPMEMVISGMLSITGELELQDDECVVALAEDSTGYILARSEWMSSVDLIPGATAEDNSFNLDWDQNLSVGVYLLSIRGWSNGEDDAGIDVHKVTPLWVVPGALYYVGDEWLDKRHGDLIMSPGETMEWLLTTRRKGYWMVEDGDRGKRVRVMFDKATWLDLAFSDLNDNVRRVITGPSPIDKTRKYVNTLDFWNDPLAHLAKVWYWGVRKNGDTLYLVDSESDG